MKILLVYRSILEAIYAPKNYYQRVITLFREYKPLQTWKFHVQSGYIGALFKSIIFLGVIGKERIYDALANSLRLFYAATVIKLAFW